jgi:hypothetical protein
MEASQLTIKDKSNLGSIKTEPEVSAAFDVQMKAAEPQLIQMLRLS